MRRNYWVVVASALVIGVVTGCSDTVVSPVAPSSSAPTSMFAAPVGRPTLSLSGENAANGTTQFTVSPSGGVYFVGNHAIVFPARSICDPATSTYGPGEWNAPCTPLDRSLTVTARVSTQGGARAVDFTPEIRFVPSSNPARWVWLFMYTPEARGAHDLAAFNILFTAAPGVAPVNDAASDPTLRTYVDTRAGLTFRRIQHFSGYMVASGFACDPATDGPDCIESDEGK